MNSTLDQPAQPLTLESLHRELVSLRQRVEDLEDRHDLEDAISENAGKPLLEWDHAKRDLGLD